MLNSAHRRTWLEGLCFLCIQKETGAKEIKERADFDILMYGKPYIVLWEIWPTQVYANQQVEYIAEAFCNFFLQMTYYLSMAGERFSDLDQLNSLSY